MLYAVLDQVVEEYQSVVNALEARVGLTETAVLAGEPDVSRRLQALFSELTTFHRALRLLPGIGVPRLGFETYDVGGELRRLLRHAENRVLCADRVEGSRFLLQNTVAAPTPPS